jgi:hypothetical protein
MERKPLDKKNCFPATFWHKSHDNNQAWGMGKCSWQLAGNPKSEYRNPKQIQISKIQMTKTCRSGF